MKSGWEHEGAFSQENEGMEEKLWEYIDGMGTEAERSAIESLLVEHAAWRAKYNELLELHSLMDASELEQPSMRFTRNIMEEIAKYHIAPATRNYINKKIIWGIAAFFITVIVGFLVYAFSQAVPNTNVAGTGFGGVDFSQIDYSRVFSNNFVNAFMMLNIVLGLLLLDHYLAQQKKGWQQKEAL
jgi:hypothetical protein